MDNAGSALTFIHEGSESALQFTHPKYTGPKTLTFSPEQLIRLATNGIEKVKDPKQKLSGSGGRYFGKFGTVVVKGGEPAHSQAWVHWNNQSEVIYVTYVASPQPDEQEAREAHQVAMLTSFG